MAHVTLSESKEKQEKESYKEDKAGTIPAEMNLGQPD
jgi:hypothetical protein